MSDFTAVDLGTGVAGNASAETIFDGANDAINPFIDHFQPQIAAAVVSGVTHTIPISDSDSHLTDVTPSTISSYTEFDLPTTIRPNSKVVYRITATADGLVQLPSANVVDIKGEVRGGFLNIITIQSTSASDSTTRLNIVVENLPSLAASTKTLVFRQDMSANDGVTGYLEDLGEFFKVNDTSGTPTTETKYSVLENIENFRARDGFFYWRAEWLLNGTIQALAEFRQPVTGFDAPQNSYAVQGFRSYTLNPAVSGSGTAFGGGTLTFGGLNMNLATTYAAGGFLVKADKTVAPTTADLFAWGLRSMFGMYRTAPTFFALLSVDPLNGLSVTNPNGMVPGSTLNTNQFNLFSLTPSELASGSF